ncbi:hypothetical protein K493DRAFT_62945, partial [Basidiobolus meristosporus CBS 931.73]
MAVNSYYERCSPILQRRLYSTVFLIVAYVYTLLYLWQARFSDGLGFFWKFFSIRLIWWSALVSFSLVTLVFARKVLLQVKRDTDSSLLSSFLRIFQKRFLIIGALHSLSAFLISSYYFGLKRNEKYYELFKYPEGKYEPPRINELYLVVFLHSCGLALYYTSIFVLQEKSQLRFPIIQQSRFFALKGRLPTILYTSVRISLVYLRGFFVLYLLFGHTIQNCITFVLGIFVTVTPYPISRGILFDFGLITRVILSGTLITLCWEIQNHIFEICFTEHVNVSDMNVNPNACLISGLQLNSKPYMQHLAYLELWRIAKFSPTRRSLIFRDIEKNPTSWQQISSECIKAVDGLTSSIKQHMNKHKPDTSKPAASHKANIQQNSFLNDAFPQKHKIANLPSAIPANPGRSLPSIFAKPADPLVQKPEHSRILGPSDNIYQPVNATTQNWEGKILSLITTLIKRWKWGQALLVQTEEEQAKALFDSIQLQIWAIQALSRFTATSLTEDLYGTVQRDIPRILECLLACLITIETFIQAPPIHSNPGKARDTHQRLQRQSFAVVNALQTSIYEITTTFYENLSGYKFPPKYALRLQSFMDFKE